MYPYRWASPSLCNWLANDLSLTASAADSVSSFSPFLSPFISLSMHLFKLSFDDAFFTLWRLPCPPNMSLPALSSMAVALRLLVLCWLFGAGCSQSSPPWFQNITTTLFNSSGDILLGGLFPINDLTSNLSQRVEPDSISCDRYSNTRPTYSEWLMYFCLNMMFVLSSAFIL